jgi:hypothetical protein
MTGWRSAGSTLVKILLGTILVGVVGDLIAGYYADVREASKLKQDLGNQVMTLTAEEADDISVLAQDLAPQSWLVGRCFDDPPRLPKVAEPSGDACHSAVFDSILQEQELQLAVRATHLNGEVLHQRLQTTLEQGEAASAYGDLLLGLEALRKLNSSTSCRWMTEDLEAQLVGPDDPAGCDQHGEEYPAAAAFVARGLAFEGEVVNATMASADVEGVNDTRRQLFGSILGDPFLWGVAIVAGVLLVLTRVRKVSK